MKKHMEYKGFIGTIEYSTDDNCYFGKVKEINDLISYEGESIEKLKLAFIESIEDYLNDDN